MKEYRIFRGDFFSLYNIEQDINNLAKEGWTVVAGGVSLAVGGQTGGPYYTIMMEKEYDAERV